MYISIRRNIKHIAENLDNKGKGNPLLLNQLLFVFWYDFCDQVFFF